MSEEILGRYATEFVGTERSRTAFRSFARYFAAWCETTDRPFPDVAPVDILDFQEHLRRDRRNSETTISSKTRGLANFYRWAVSAGLVDSYPLAGIPTMPVRVKPRNTYSLKELRCFWYTAPTLRHRVAVGLLGILGLPLDDVVALDIPDIRRRQPYGTLNLRPRNGARSDVQVLIPAELMAAIDEYVAGRRSGPLLTTKDGRRLSRHAVYGVLKTVEKNSGLAIPVSPSTLSYTLRALALEHGFSYLGTVAATGEIGASRGRRWIASRDARPEQHAMIRLAHLLFDDPSSPNSMIFEAAVALTESALPPAIAVMTAGAALERHLRELSQCLGIQFDKPASKLQLGAYISRLTGAGALTAADNRLLTAIETWRNKAAHGWFDEIGHSDAVWVLNTCRELIARYPLPPPAESA